MLSIVVLNLNIEYQHESLTLINRVIAQKKIAKYG